MNLYEKIKNQSIEEMTGFLVAVYVGGACSLFSFVPDEKFAKFIPNYDEVYNMLKSKLMEEDEE